MSTHWPKKYDVLGVQVSATDYGELADIAIEAAQRHEPTIISHHAVHAIVTSSQDKALLGKVNAFHSVTPDGQPVRWALRMLYGIQLPDRVYGPEFMARLCAIAAEKGVSIYLYGSMPEVLEKLQSNLQEKFPGIKIAGTESPPYRKLSEDEKVSVIARINSSGAGIVFIGLGCPKQDHAAFDFKDRIRAVQVCVGAAFDFHAGTKKSAPEWMQDHGMEWVFRLFQEPRRLWKRYAVTNSVFVAKLVFQWLRGTPPLSYLPVIKSSNTQNVN